MQHIAAREIHTHCTQKAVVDSTTTSRCPLLLAIAHIVRSQLQVEACGVQEWQVRNLAPGTFEADHTDGAGGHRHPFHLKMFTPLATIRKFRVGGLVFVG